MKSKLNRVLALRLKQGDFLLLKKTANDKGMKPSELARYIIIERIKRRKKK
ncbi:MAG: hypothetical protein QXZ17_01560 [Nitrososphaerota archaeon]